LQCGPQGRLYPAIPLRFILFLQNIQVFVLYERQVHIDRRIKGASVHELRRIEPVILVGQVATYIQVVKECHACFSILNLAMVVLSEVVLEQSQLWHVINVKWPNADMLWFLDYQYRRLVLHEKAMLDSCMGFSAAHIGHGASYSASYSTAVGMWIAVGYQFGAEWL